MCIRDSCNGVLLQGKIHMVFLRHMGESLDILVTDLDIGKTGVLAGKLFKTLPAAVDFGPVSYTHLDVADQRGIIEAFRFDPEIFRRFFAFALRVHNQGVHQL